MNDKKQIEEMAQDIASNCPDLVENCCGSKACYVCIAEGLAKDNYRKLPEDSVVLSKEEYQKDFSSQFNKGYKHGSKETAREIFDKLYTWLRLEEISKYGFVTIQKFDFLRKFREIIGQYGVEVSNDKD